MEVANLPSRDQLSAIQTGSSASSLRITYNRHGTYYQVNSPKLIPPKINVGNGYGDEIQN
eukprot:4938583-Amphidinium_carterae.2